MNRSSPCSTPLPRRCSVAPSELLSRQPPNRRAKLEIAIEEAQQDPAFAALGLPRLKVGARVPNDVLEHLAALHAELRRQRTKPTATPEEARAANAVLRQKMRERGNYFAAIEQAAGADAGGGRLPRRCAVTGHDPVDRHQTRLHRALRPGPAPFGAVGDRSAESAHLCQAGVDRHAHAAHDPAADDRPFRARPRRAGGLRRLPAPAGGGELLRRRRARPRAARRRASCARRWRRARCRWRT